MNSQCIEPNNNRSEIVLQGPLLLLLSPKRSIFTKHYHEDSGHISRLMVSPEINFGLINNIKLIWCNK